MLNTIHLPFIFQKFIFRSIYAQDTSLCGSPILRYQDLILIHLTNYVAKLTKCCLCASKRLWLFRIWMIFCITKYFLKVLFSIDQRGLILFLPFLKQGTLVTFKYLFSIYIFTVITAHLCCGHCMKSELFWAEVFCWWSAAPEKLYQGPMQSLMVSLHKMTKTKWCKVTIVVNNHYFWFDLCMDFKSIFQWKCYKT